MSGPFMLWLSDFRANCVGKLYAYTISGKNVVQGLFSVRKLMTRLVHVGTEKLVDSLHLTFCDAAQWLDSSFCLYIIYNKRFVRLLASSTETGHQTRMD